MSRGPRQGLNPHWQHCLPQEPRGNGSELSQIYHVAQKEKAQTSLPLTPTCKRLTACDQDNIDQGSLAATASCYRIDLQDARLEIRICTSIRH